MVREQLMKAVVRIVSPAASDIMTTRGDRHGAATALGSSRANPCSARSAIGLLRFHENDSQG